MTDIQVYAMHVKDMMDKQREFFRVNRDADLKGGREWNEALRIAKKAEKNVRDRTQAALDGQRRLFE